MDERLAVEVDGKKFYRPPTDEEILEVFFPYFESCLIKSGKPYWIDFNSNEYFIPLTMYSDYYGSCVEKANCIYFLDTYSFLSERGLSHNGACATFTLDDIREAVMAEPDMLADFFHDLESLENYPIIDENLLNEIEMEVQNEMWTDWGRWDFICELEHSFNMSDSDVEYLRSHPDEVDEFFWKMADRANEYWQMESASSAYINLERIAWKATQEEVDLLLEKGN